MGFLTHGAVAWTTDTTNPSLNADCTGADTLIVAAAWKNTNGTVINTAMYNGVGMTRIGSAFSSVASGAIHTIDFFKLASPASGSNAIVVTANNDLGTVGTGAVHYWVYSGVDLTTIQTDINTEAIAPFSSVGANVTSTTGNFVIALAAVDSSSATGGTVTGGTEVSDDIIASSPNQLSTGSHAPGGSSVAMGISFGPAGDFDACWRALSLAASGGGGGGGGTSLAWILA